MARAVVLYFEDNADADEFIKYKDKAFIENDKGQFESIGGTVELMVGVPTLFCEGGHKRGKFSMAYTMGLKWGWWVCIHCKKPAGNVSFMKTLRACLSQAKQLLPEADEATEEVFDEGWGALGRD